MLDSFAAISIFAATLKSPIESIFSSYLPQEQALEKFINQDEITKIAAIQNQVVTNESTLETIKLGIPYINQKEALIGTQYEQIGGSACGPATIAMALNYANEKIDLESVITKLPGTVYVKGKMFYDLMSGPKYFGYSAVPIESGVDKIYGVLKSGNPILMNIQNYDGITGHEIVVVGIKNYDRANKTAEALIAHDPFREAYREFKILNDSTLEQPEGYYLPIGILKPFYIVKSALASTDVVK
uniref:Peptidase C39-like domain-containing protein n=1 Tax=candidate division WWE3 bacterium TaxID=2053526 RepID=A0A7C4XNB0_UNCKA